MLPNYRSSALFSGREKVALDFAVAVMRTPVEVTDELFAGARRLLVARQTVYVTISREGMRYGLSSGEGSVVAIGHVPQLSSTSAESSQPRP